MSETKENCPDCGHFRPHHFKSYYAYDRGCFWDDCPCPRTYESLVGEKALSDDELIALAQSKGISCCSNCGKAFHKDKGCSCANPDKTICPCQKWAGQADWIDGHHPNCDGHGKPKTQFVTGMSVEEKYPSLCVCGHGEWCPRCTPEPSKSQQETKDTIPQSTKDIVKAESLCPVCIQDRIFMQHDLDRTKKTDVGKHVGHCSCTPTLSVEQLKNGMEHHPQCTRDTTLQLLVIDMGDSCVVKVEKGEFKWTVAHTFNVDKSVMLSGHTFAKLKEAIDGVKPVHIKRADGEYEIVDANGYGHYLPTPAYRALTKINDDKPLPIYENGKWEMLVGEGGEVHADTGLSIWRYKKNA